MNASARRQPRRRLPDLEAQAALSVDEFLRSLGIENLRGFGATEGLFLNILTACEYIGLLCKARIDRDRPNVVAPRLQPLLAVSADDSCPSNHSLQYRSITFAFDIILPEQTATDELARVGRSVAENCEPAGLHLPSDTEAGK